MKKTCLKYIFKNQTKSFDFVKNNNLFKSNLFDSKLFDFKNNNNNNNNKLFNSKSFNKNFELIPKNNKISISKFSTNNKERDGIDRVVASTLILSVCLISGNPKVLLIGMFIIIWIN